MKMDLCGCRIALGNDLRNVVVKDKNSPVTYAETFVLMQLHGRGSVTDIQVVAQAEVDPAREKLRLAEKYNGQVVEMLFPGNIPTLPGSLASYQPAPVMGDGDLDTPKAIETPPEEVVDQSEDAPGEDIFDKPETEPVPAPAPKMPKAKSKGA